MSHIGIEAMENEDRLKLQAWLDGELPTHEAARVADWVEANPSARELAEELRAVKVALQVGEMPVTVEDSREFYWSQVERQIEAEEPITENTQPELVSGSLGNALRWLIPVGSLAAISALMLNFDSINTTPDLPETSGSKIDNPQTNPINSPSGLAEGVGTVLEEESPATPEVGIFSFEGTQNGGNFASPEDPNTLPESIENPER